MTRIGLFAVAGAICSMVRGVTVAAVGCMVGGAVSAPVALFQAMKHGAGMMSPSRS
jgi:hypothetical protein